MAIKLVEYQKKRPNTRYHPEKKVWIGYKIDVRVGGKRPRGGVFPTRKEAEDYIDQLKLAGTYKKSGIKYSPGKAADVKLKDLFDRRIADIDDDKRKKLVKRVLYYLLDITGEQARVTDLTFQHLKRFNERRAREKTVGRETPVTDATIDREMTEISSTLKDAGDYFEALQGWQPPKIPRLALVDTRRERRIEDWEALGLIAHFARPREPFESDGQYFDRVLIGHSFEFALLTSSRRKEVVRLKKTAYQARADILKIFRWKTRKAKKQSVSVFSPVPKRVREILELRARLDPESEYFFSRDGRDSYGYLKAMRLACKKLGIPYGRYTEGGLIFHDTRHTFVSTMIENRVDLETARDLAGLSRDMILRYAHASPESKGRAAAVIDRWSGNGHSEPQKMLADLYEKVRRGDVESGEFVALILDLWSKSGHTAKAASA